MLAAVQRLSFSLHPLLAEARRRARRRRMAVLAAVVIIAAGGGGAVAAFHPFGWLQAGVASPGNYQPGTLITCSGCPTSLYSAPPMTAVSASSRDSAWIVGADTAWRWDGSAWRSVPLPHVANAYLQSVSAIGPADAWAVGFGERDEEINNTALIEHWNGARWTVVRPEGLSPAMLSAVSASGPRDVWAAGVTSTAKSDKQLWRKSLPLLLHWDGVAWRRQPLPWARVGLGLGKVVATGPSSVWVVPQASGQGQPALEHWNGTRWRSVPAPFGPQDPVSGFSATAGNDAWAVGSYAQHGNGTVRSYPLAAHWNGSAWRFTPVPSRPGDNASLLNDVVAVRPDDAWAIGQTQPVRPDEAIQPVLSLLHWDGRSWTAAPGSARSSFFSSATIGVVPDGAAWAIGDCGDDNVVLGWNGERWTVVPHPRDARWQASTPARVRHRERGIKTCAATASGG